MRLALVFVLGVAILAIIYQQVEVTALLDALGGTRLGWLAVSIAMLAPIVLMSAWRLTMLVPAAGGLAFAEANKLVLASVTLNLVLPSHTGDLVKAYFLIDRGRISGSLALSLVVFERLCDLFGLFLWCLVGLALALSLVVFERLCDLFGLFLWCLVGLALHGLPESLSGLLAVAAGVGLALSLTLILWPASARPIFATLALAAPARLAPRIANLEASWRELTAYVLGNRRAIGAVAAVSVLLWLLHGAQIWLLILALGAWTPFGANMVLAPLALLIGMLPITLAGIGTRDAAFIFLYAPYLAPATGAALGLLSLLRYLLPGFAGLPFLARYMAAVRARPALR